MRLAGSQSFSHSFMLNGFIGFIIITPGKRHTAPHPGATLSGFCGMLAMVVAVVWNLKKINKSLRVNEKREVPWLFASDLKRNEKSGHMGKVIHSSQTH